MDLPEPHESGEFARPALPVTFSQVMNWVVGMLATIMLSVGAWIFNGVNNGILDLKREVIEVKLQLAEFKATNREIDEIKATLIRLQEEMTRFRENRDNRDNRDKK